MTTLAPGPGVLGLRKRLMAGRAAALTEKDFRIEAGNRAAAKRAGVRLEGRLRAPGARALWRLNANRLGCDGRQRLALAHDLKWIRALAGFRGGLLQLRLCLGHV